MLTNMVDLGEHKILNKIKRIHVAITEAEQDWLNTQASKQGLSVATYVRARVLADMPPMVLLSNGKIISIKEYNKRK